MPCLDLKKEELLDVDVMRNKSQIGVIQAKLGQKQKALESFASLEKEKYSYGEVPYYQARILAHIGDRKGALNLLQEAVHLGSQFHSFNVYEGDLDLQILRNSKRFQEIIHPLVGGQ